MTTATVAVNKASSVKNCQGRRVLSSDPPDGFDPPDVLDPVGPLNVDALGDTWNLIEVFQFFVEARL
jgi:hypothetical protein